ncbi:MAG TPA: ISAzo13 family transposase [Phycisphaerae bacterium]|nr:ISAzo13 family transposase [Phycisphaerae bacterium]
MGKPIESQTGRGDEEARPQCLTCVGDSTVKKTGLSLKANRKRFTGPPHPDRDLQFRYIQKQKERFLRRSLPVISVDTKNKELIGDSKNPGRTWTQEPIEVNAHDFPQDALCKVAPYGVYDVGRNHGFIHVGISSDTPQFAVDSIRQWWLAHGRKHYGEGHELLILADAGGSNGYRPRHFKKRLQERIADAFDLKVTVCHFPSGASKWNPVEHRLFGPISCHWSGIPLRSLELLLRLVRTTVTQGGLKVCARLTQTTYRTGIRVSDAEMRILNLKRHTVCPQWNYTINPRQRT